MMGYMKLFITILMFGTANATSAVGQPGQIHLSLGASPGDMVVTFVTLGSADTSVASWVEFKVGTSVTRVPAKASTYSAGGWVGVVHRATLHGLKQGHSYSYRCGVEQGSASEWFPILYADKKDLATNVSFAIVADLDGRELAGNTTIKAPDAQCLAGGIIHITFDRYNREPSPSSHRPCRRRSSREQWMPFSILVTSPISKAPRTRFFCFPDCLLAFLFVVKCRGRGAFHERVLHHSPTKDGPDPLSRTDRRRMMSTLRNSSPQPPGCHTISLSATRPDDYIPCASNLEERCIRASSVCWMAGALE